MRRPWFEIDLKTIVINICHGCCCSVTEWNCIRPITFGLKSGSQTIANFPKSQLSSTIQIICVFEIYVGSGDPDQPAHLCRLGLGLHCPLTESLDTVVPVSMYNGLCGFTVWFESLLFLYDPRRHIFSWHGPSANFRIYFGLAWKAKLYLSLFCQLHFFYTLLPMSDCHDIYIQHLYIIDHLVHSKNSENCPIFDGLMALEVQNVVTMRCACAWLPVNEILSLLSSLVTSEKI